jgi:hypothetical protein
MQPVMTTSIMVQCAEFQCGTCTCLHVCACIAMGPLPLQDTWKFHSFRSERKLEQSRGQLKEKNINHNNVPIAVRGSSLFVFSLCDADPCCKMGLQ